MSDEPVHYVPAPRPGDHTTNVIAEVTCETCLRVKAWQRPHISREVKHAAPAAPSGWVEAVGMEIGIADPHVTTPAPLPEPAAGRLPTPEAMAVGLVGADVGVTATTMRRVFVDVIGARDAAILARLDAIAKAADDGRLSALTMLDALRAELREGAA